MTAPTDVTAWEGRTVRSADGDKLGTIEQLYVDQQDGYPTFATVSAGFLGTRHHFVPLASARQDGEAVLVPFSKDQVKSAPGVEEDAELTAEEEERLYSHYGVLDGAPAGGGADSGTTTGQTVADDLSGPATDDAMTRSEEELHVGVERREAGRVRLRKYVVTENVTQTVPVTREEVRVEREPITEQNADAAYDGPAISEEEAEVVLHEERPVVTKEAVAKERVRLGTETRTEQQQVAEDVRKEVIDVTDPVQTETR